MSSIVSYANTNNNNHVQEAQSNERKERKHRLNISQRLHNTGILAFVSFVILLIAFACPYWLSSYGHTSSKFKHMGLWDFCFQDYRHPFYQYDTKFTGCHWIYSNVFLNVRDWLQPAWLIFVQTMMTFALCLSAIGLISVSALFMHYLIRFQIAILLLAFVCHLFVALFLGFAVTVFALKAFDRNWIQYPNFNHLDWAYILAVISFLGNCATTYLYLGEIRTLKAQMGRMKRLVISTDKKSDIDSLDAVYTSRSYNPGTPVGLDRSTYPHFTQV